MSESKVAVSSQVSKSRAVNAVRYLGSRVDPITPKAITFVAGRLKSEGGLIAAFSRLEKLKKELDNDAYDFVKYWSSQGVGIQTIIQRYNTFKATCWLLLFVMAGLSGLFLMFSYNLINNGVGIMGVILTGLQIILFGLMFAYYSMHLWRVRSYSIYAVHWLPAIKADFKELLPLSLEDCYEKKLKEQFHSDQKKRMVY